MLGLFLIFFIGKYYYELAQDYYKHRWLYGIFGIIVYYIGTAIGGVILGFLDLIFAWNFDWENSLFLGFLALPFGIAATYAIYSLLKKKWKNEVVVVKDEIQDIGKNTENADKN